MNNKLPSISRIRLVIRKAIHCVTECICPTSGRVNKASKAPPVIDWRELERPSVLRKYEQAPPYVVTRKADEASQEVVRQKL